MLINCVKRVCCTFLPINDLDKLEDWSDDKELGSEGNTGEGGGCIS